MGLLQYTHAVTGTSPDGVAHSFTATYQGPCTAGTVRTLDVTSAWQPVEVNVFTGVCYLKNTGTEDAIIRVTNGSDYIRFRLPVGCIWGIHLDRIRAATAGFVAGIVAVYSASGTTVEVASIY